MPGELFVLQQFVRVSVHVHDIPLSHPWPSDSRVVHVHVWHKLKQTGLSLTFSNLKCSTATQTMNTSTFNFLFSLLGGLGPPQIS